MDHHLIAKLKAHLASLRDRLGDDDPDVRELETIVKDAEPPAETGTQSS